MQETGEPPDSENQRAFALLSFGLPIYRAMAHAQYFPATSAKARRRGSRAVRGSLPVQQGERAVIFMTHCVPAFAVAFWQCQYRQGRIDNVTYYEDYHGAIRDLLGVHYPLDDEDARALTDARREVDVFDTHVPVRAEWRGGPVTGYGRALEEGENPDDARS